jgi:hypothetical protein
MQERQVPFTFRSRGSISSKAVAPAMLLIQIYPAIHLCASFLCGRIASTRGNELFLNEILNADSTNEISIVASLLCG